MSERCQLLGGLGRLTRDAMPYMSSISRENSTEDGAVAGGEVSEVVKDMAEWLWR